jgi:hypothetical protein
LPRRMIASLDAAGGTGENDLWHDLTFRQGEAGSSALANGAGANFAARLTAPERAPKYL